VQQINSAIAVTATSAKENHRATTTNFSSTAPFEIIADIHPTKRFSRYFEVKGAVKQQL
jgi:hypothetical protein